MYVNLSYLASGITHVSKKTFPMQERKKTNEPLGATNAQQCIQFVKSLSPLPTLPLPLLLTPHHLSRTATTS